MFGASGVYDREPQPALVGMRLSVEEAPPPAKDRQRLTGPARLGALFGRRGLWPARSTNRRRFGSRVSIGRVTGNRFHPVQPLRQGETVDGRYWGWKFRLPQSVNTIFPHATL